MTEKFEHLSVWSVATEEEQQLEREQQAAAEATGTENKYKNRNTLTYVKIIFMLGDHIRFDP